MTTEDEGSELEEFEKAVLIAMCDAVNYSKAGHVPEGTVCRKFKSDLHGDVKTVLKKKLKKDGYIVRHPTGSNNTYQLTDKGFRACQIINDKLRKKQFS
ncbi:MAG: hypothetical protein M1476_02655 [Candidatus Thermoplasmatota archaeon]|nr:hypothetical protein [Candidatus Thermoplasmatota archaeon]